MDAERADGVADEVAEEDVLVFGVFTVLPRPGLTADRTRPPCMESASVVVKKNVIATMWAGL